MKDKRGGRDRREREHREREHQERDVDKTIERDVENATMSSEAINSEKSRGYRRVQNDIVEREL